MSKTIFINGKKETVQTNTISFEDLVKLAKQPDYSTVQYTRSIARKPSGVLLKGESVTLFDGMVFDVVPTGHA